MTVEVVEYWTVLEDFLGRFAGAVDRIIDAELYFAFTIKLPHERQLGEITAGILNLTPAQVDRALHAEQKFARFFFRSWRLNDPHNACIRVKHGIH